MVEVGGSGGAPSREMRGFGATWISLRSISLLVPYFCAVTIPRDSRVCQPRVFA